MIGRSFHTLVWQGLPIIKKTFRLYHSLHCKRRKANSLRGTTLVYEITHTLRDTDSKRTLYPSLLTAGPRLRLLSRWDFRQPLRGQFHTSLPLLSTDQQLSVLRNHMYSSSSTHFTYIVENKLTILKYFCQSFFHPLTLIDTAFIIVYCVYYRNVIVFDQNSKEVHSPNENDFSNLFKGCQTLNT